MSDDPREPTVVGNRFVRTETPRRYRSPDRGAIGVGWVPLVDAVFNLLDVAAPGWVLSQVKQDLGGLDVYYDLPETADPRRVRATRAAIAAIRDLASVTCEICGAAGHQITSNGWLSIFCGQHTDHQGPIPILGYLTKDARPSRRTPTDAERAQDELVNERIRAAAATTDLSQVSDPDTEMMHRVLATPWQSAQPRTGKTHEIVAAVRDLLGSKLVAYLADAPITTVHRWADPRDPATPPPEVIERLHLTHRVASSITRYDSPAVARGWFLGSAADGTAPARRIREGNPREVEPELKARIAETLGRPPSP